MLDSVAKVITETGQALNVMPEDARPGRVFVIVATDGEENCSKEYTRQQVKDLIDQQQNVYNWEFLFIGADVDAFHEAGGIGISQNATLATSADTTKSVASAFAGTSAAMLRGRVTGQSVSYTSEERDAAQ